MTIEQFERAKTILSCIKSADENIDKYKKYQELNEVALIDKTGDLKPLYLSQKEIKEMMQIAIDHWRTFKEMHERELANL